MAFDLGKYAFICVYTVVAFLYVCINEVDPMAMLYLDEIILIANIVNHITRTAKLSFSECYGKTQPFMLKFIQIC